LEWLSLAWAESVRNEMSKIRSMRNIDTILKLRTSLIPQSVSLVI
jgi:hypothetical protein